MNTKKNSQFILSWAQAIYPRAETPYLDSVYYSQVGVIRDVVNMISNYYAAAVTQAPGHAYRPHVVLLGHYSNMYGN